MSEMQQILTQQKREFHTSQTKQRQYLIQRKMKDIRRDRQQMSDGSVKHDDLFRKSNRQLEFFDPKFPLLKFPQDTVLNTYDNTKRWLKEIDIPDKKQYWQELKQNDFKHYEGDPWNYITKANRYFEGFKAYHFIEHEESGIEKNQRIKSQDQYKYMVPPTRTPSEFSRPQFDKTYIINPLNPIHEVKYIPGLIVDRSKLSSMHKTRGSMLNDLQTVKPFTAQNTRSQPFQKKYKPLNCEDQQLQSTLRTDVDSEI